MPPPRDSSENAANFPSASHAGRTLPPASSGHAPQQFTELDLKTEKVLLGTLIRGGGENIADVLEVGLRPEDFYRDAHKEIFTAIAELYNRDDSIDSLTLSDRLRKRNTYESVGGEAYLAELEDHAIGYYQASRYAKIVVDRAALRSLGVAAMEIAEKCSEGPESVDSLLNDVEEEIFGIRDRRFKGSIIYLPDKLMAIQERIMELAALEGRLSGVPTGFKYLDRLTGGFQKSDLIVLGGRPGMGKTAITLNLAMNAALPWRREAFREMPAYSVMFFSMEMSLEQIMMRILCQMSELDLLKMRSGALKSEELTHLTSAMQQLQQAPVYIDDTSGKKMNPMELRAKAKRLQRNLERHRLPPLGLIVVDYLQLLNPDPTENRNRNREREVAEMSGALKSLAKELDIAVLCCSQLKRSDEGAPEMSDLRDSGAIEQDADLVAFILRKEVLHPDKPEYQGLGELQLKKHRNGPTGVVHLHFAKECCCFKPAAYESVEDAEGGAY
ncbi:MAG: replicative DNA helicase [Deltaproteobacteria bacterium]|jgi:replicative DNA helicase|nr:replicative DNA helicase [Deltaproteobacteria bacterium]